MSSRRKLDQTPTFSTGLLDHRAQGARGADHTGALNSLVLCQG